MKKDKSWVQLAGYFAGELSSEETKKMESWIKADPDREEEVNRLFEIWKATESLPYELDVDNAWMKLSGGMEEIEKRKTEEDTQFPKMDALYMHFPKKIEKINNPGVFWRRTALVAATVLIVALAGFFSFYAEKQADLAATDQIENRVFVTKNGERATYVLNDGSKVMLHAGSRLEIPDDFNENERELYLEGEAYFEVAHNEAKPFVVQSKHAYTRVLGTRFLVQAWPEIGERVEVVVSDGKVAFGDIRNGRIDNKVHEVLLTKNKMGVLDNNKPPIVTDVADLDWYIGWTEGRLEFENRPLTEVLPRLERWYNIEIRVEDEQIREKKITAEIDYSQSMSEVLQGISLTLELEVEKTGRVFTFKSSE